MKKSTKSVVRIWKQRIILLFWFALALSVGFWLNGFFWQFGMTAL